MDKLLGLVLSRGGVRWGAGGILAASGAALLSGYVVPDASQEAQIGGAALLVGGIVAAILGPRIASALGSRIGGGSGGASPPAGPSA